MNSKLHSSKKKTIVLIDDHHLVRAGLRSLLDDIDNYEVVAEGSDGDQALGLLQQHNPDLLIMDIAMKRTSGLQALKDIKPQFPHLPVILLSMHASGDYLRTAFNHGAQAYLLKDSAEVELELALSAVENNEKYVSPKLSQKLIDELATPAPDTLSSSDSTPLTQRQLEILKMICEGMGTKEIAFELHLSNKTVESHRAQIMERLGLRDVASLVRYAYKKGLIQL